MFSCSSYLPSAALSELFVPGMELKGFVDDLQTEMVSVQHSAAVDVSGEAMDVASISDEGGSSGDEEVLEEG